MKEQVFHIYKKNTEKTQVIQHSVSVDEIEKMIANKEIKWAEWEIQPCCVEYNLSDISF